MPATVLATTSDLNPTFFVDVVSQIEWSILEDEAELLLLI
jgi:hypothetical protein